MLPLLLHSAFSNFRLIPDGYFRNGGVDVMAFDDIYPEGHQAGVSLMMNGLRIGSMGDVRLEHTPGQWQAVPITKSRVANLTANTIVTNLHFPDPSRHLTGFNPMIYPDIEFDYNVTVLGSGDSVIVTVDLDRPIPQTFLGKVGFNFELFPALLYGKPYLMDDFGSVFPRQANGPTKRVPTNADHHGNWNPAGKANATKLESRQNGYNPIVADDIIAEPYAKGHKFTARPDDPAGRFTITSDLLIELYDGRMNHNNGWFVLRSEIPAGATKNAVRWKITPTVTEYHYKPVVQVSQVGYHPNQPKIALIELDGAETKYEKLSLLKYGHDGLHPVLNGTGKVWGKFLRYNYLKFDFTAVKDPGLYKLQYGASVSSPFRISEDIYERGVWQPTIEYFLPVQMCHMRVMEKYRVWHDRCHMDDAKMAPTNYNHIDGYEQGPSTLTSFKSGEQINDISTGGWHDAGDYDLRVESQSTESYTLALIYETFPADVNYDHVKIDFEKHIVDIHEPDGKNDVLQQCENGARSILATYRKIGRLYRGIIVNDLRQYVLLGDAHSHTDGVQSDDDRWLFTEDNPARELQTAAHLAGISRALRGHNNTIAQWAFDAAVQLYNKTAVPADATIPKIHAAVELYLATNSTLYSDYLLKHVEEIVASIEESGWFVARAEKRLKNAEFTAKIKNALRRQQENLRLQSEETPYGIPYRPKIWGAGWDIQAAGFKYFFLYDAYPDLFPPDFVYNAVNFVLGVHPGFNTASFAGGVGAKSAIPLYGNNRADASYIPGGVISGTALIRPDYPELQENWGFNWQQHEVCIGHTSDFVFLVLAAQRIARNAGLK